jgi:hypothetical protein
MDTNHLVKARSMLSEGSEGCCQKGNFVSLCCDMPPPNISTLGLLDRLTLAVRSINQHEWNMLTVMERLDWMCREADRNEHIRSRWYYYASADIEFWHVNFRSLLDQVALVISELAEKRKQVPDDSFRKLYERSQPEELCKPDGALFVQKLGSDWLALIQTATWFTDFVKVREQVVHYGGHTMVFEEPSKGILFQVYGSSYRNLVRMAPLMFNQNVVYFEKYAAHLMSHLLVFLEQFASIVYARLDKFRNSDDTASNCGPGWATLKAWIDLTLNAGSE